MSDTKLRNRVLRSQSREIVYNVWKYMQSGEINVSPLLQRTADATGTSVRTVSRIVKECKNSNNFNTPGKHRKRDKPITGISSFDKGIIKRCIHTFYVTEKQMPTTQKLLTKFRKDIRFKGSESSLKQILKGLGFQWRRTNDTLRAIIEKPNIRVKRIEFLRNIKMYREEGREIVYVGRTVVNLKHAQDSKMAKKQQIFVLNAGSETGFLPNARVILKSNELKMTFGNYEKWLKTKVLSKLKPNSVIVLENNLSYNNKLANTIPTLNSKRTEIISWLDKEKIPHTDDMLKPELHKLILQNGGSTKTYVVDKIFTERNHIVIRLPPTHPDLSPMDIAGTEITKYVAERNNDNNIAHVVQLIKEKTDAMSDEWIALCKKIHYIENQYRSSDRVIDDMTDKYPIHNTASSESESDCDMQSEVSSGSDYDPTANQNDLLMEVSDIKRSKSDSDDDQII